MSKSKTPFNVVWQPDNVVAGKNLPYAIPDFFTVVNLEDGFRNLRPWLRFEYSNSGSLKIQARIGIWFGLTWVWQY